MCRKFMQMYSSPPGKVAFQAFVQEETCLRRKRIVCKPVAISRETRFQILDHAAAVTAAAFPRSAVTFVGPVVASVHVCGFYCP